MRSKSTQYVIEPLTITVSGDATLLKNMETLNLGKYELEELVIFQRASTCLNRDMLDCDLYGLLKGEPEYQETFQGEYMNQYSWAEPDLAALVQWCGK